jgi:hypothetical protein
MKPLREFGRIVMAILREGRVHSAEEWRRFAECQMKRKYARAKCC